MLLKKHNREDGRDGNEEEDLSGYWMTLRKCEDNEN
jgi:hypothetical protein